MIQWWQELWPDKGVYNWFLKYWDLVYCTFLETWDLTKLKNLHPDWTSDWIHSLLTKSLMSYYQAPLMLPTCSKIQISCWDDNFWIEKCYTDHLSSSNMHRLYTNIYWYAILKIQTQPWSVLAKAHPKVQNKRRDTIFHTGHSGILLHDIMPQRFS
jgi:hypothetical protein